MIAGIIAAGNRWPRVKNNRLEYLGYSGLPVGATATELFVGVYDGDSAGGKRVDILRVVNGNWGLSGSILPPEPSMAFGFLVVARSNYLAIRGFNLAGVQRVHLYEKLSGAWTYRQTIADFPEFSIWDYEFSAGGDFLVISYQNLVTFTKTPTGWSAAGITQSLSAHLHPDMFPMNTALVRAGDTIIVSFSRTGPSNGSYPPTYVTILPITWTGASWSVGASISTADGIERFYPRTATGGRALFLHNHPGVIPNDELVEYNVIDGDLVYGHTLTPPPIVDDPLTPGSGWPFDPSGYGIGPAAYVGSRLLIAATGNTGVIWGYNLYPSSSSLAYATEILSQLDKDGPSFFISGGDYYAIGYNEGEYIPDEWGGYVESDRTSIYITT